MKYKRYFTGVYNNIIDSLARNILFSVSPIDGYLLFRYDVLKFFIFFYFRKDCKSFYYFDPQNLDVNCEIELDFNDILSPEFKIFQIAHLQNGDLIIFFKNPKNNLLSLTQVSICLERKLAIISKIVKWDIEMK